MPRFGLKTLTGSLTLILIFATMFYFIRINSESTDTITGTLRNLLPSTVTASSPSKLEHASHLVIVPGHGIWKGTGDGLDDSDWYMSKFQQGPSISHTFLKHIQTGVELALSDPHAVLVFSGGQTNKVAGPTSEAGSYWFLARLHDAFVPTTNGDSLVGRMITEDYARDSYENLAFSVARFHEFTGRYPTQITVVGYEFKRRRYVDLHRAAIFFPKEKFHYEGIDPAELVSDPVKLADAKAGEDKNAATPFSHDPYGCTNEILTNKRKVRNPFNRFEPYPYTSQEMYPLLMACHSKSVDVDVIKKSLPWVDHHIRQSALPTIIPDNTVDTD